MCVSFHFQTTLSTHREYIPIQNGVLGVGVEFEVVNVVEEEMKHLSIGRRAAIVAIEPRAAFSPRIQRDSHSGFFRMVFYFGVIEIYSTTKLKLIN